MRYAAATATALLLLAGLVLAAPPQVVTELSCKVIGVTDGDTIRVLVNREMITIRLAGIDAPEFGQSYGNKAKQALAQMVAGKTVTVRTTGTDSYGRTLGTVIVEGVDANAKLVEDGCAWHFKTFSNEQRLGQLEVTARQAKRGLWADEKPLAPWEFRARQATQPTSTGETKDRTMSYWLNTSSGLRHNQRCEHYKKTKAGRPCGPNDGRPCGICGG